MRLAVLLLAATTRALRLTTRRSVIAAPAAAAVAAPALAFDGQGSSAYAGRTPQSKLELRKSYQERVAADVRDFRNLGAAIKAGELDGDAFFFFFTPQPRSKPDGAGRTYAALADLVGHPNDNNPKVLEGGCGYLLAASFAKAGKPPDNAPAVKAYASLAKTLDPIRAAAKKKSPDSAAKAYDAASAALGDYLAEVELPGIADPRYK